MADRVVGPSAGVYDGAGTPVKVHEMSEGDIDSFVEYYRKAALSSLDAGFDGVEIHGANGYVSNAMQSSHPVS